MNNIKNYLDEKIGSAEYVLGELSENEKNKIINEFFNKFTNFADEIGVDVMSILDDFDLMVELDELIDCDFETAKKVALEKLRKLSEDVLVDNLAWEKMEMREWI